MHAFGRRMDRQKDGQRDSIVIDRPRLHSMQRGKNGRFKIVTNGCSEALVAEDAFV